MNIENFIHTQTLMEEVFENEFNSFNSASIAISTFLMAELNYSKDEMESYLECLTARLSKNFLEVPLYKESLNFIDGKISRDKFKLILAKEGLIRDRK